MSPRLPGRVDAVIELEFVDVDKAFEAPDGETVPAVRSISLAVESGSFVCIVGPSGCGKSTLLNMAAGLMQPSAGEIFVRGAPLAGANTTAGYLTQHNTLLPWRSVERNVSLALEVQRMSRVERSRRVAEVLALVGLSKFARHYPAQLSGGMQKRTALARLLAYRPETLLLDEPFGALDAQLRLVLQTELIELWEKDRKTVLFVTHDLEEAILLSDRIVVIGSQPGTIVHVEDVRLPRPRDFVELKSDSEFIATWERLWHLIDRQVHEVSQ